MSLDGFHPLTRRWFQERFQAPTEPQVQGWPAIAARRDTLIAAPTGSGKTLAAFLSSIDHLLRAALAGQLEDRTYVLYVSPLRALSNDIQRNLQAPLADLLAMAREENPDCPEIRALVRTGDTPASERQRMLREPPHILVTTPESLYLVLTGQRSRDILRRVETVIVDEIHALARDKRGSHLALSLERLDALASGKWPGDRPVRIGLSATQKPMDEIARFLAGAKKPGFCTGGDVSSASPEAGLLDPAAGAKKPGFCTGGDVSSATPEAGLLDAPASAWQPDVTIVDTGHARKIDLAVEIPERPLEAICSHEHWGEVYEKLVELIRTHRSTLVFVNTRRLAERVARQLSQRLGEEAVSSHHGSLSHRIRHRTEQRLKQGDLKAVVATASLELGIDVGHIDLVCQIGSPRSIATMLQRIGRAGHSLGLVPKGRIFALTRDELCECLALVRAVYAGRLDRVQIPEAPLDILAQQIVAIVANEEQHEDELFELCRRAHPYRDLERKDYEDVLEMLSEGVSPRLGRKGAYLHRDRVGKQLRARRGARITAITCGGAIPEIADYRVVTDEDPPVTVGSVHEDFAVESLAGDIFLLGNTSWRIKQVKTSEVVVQDARGAPPTIPFWLGEAPGRTAELSSAVSDLRQELSARMPEQAADFESDGSFPGRDETIQWLMDESHSKRAAAEQVVAYVAAQKAATGLVPTQDTILFERFFDESGGMQLVVHAPFGTRVTRGWGLALRKRFCRSFNFELQASASDDGIVLSLGPQHSFPMEQMYSLVPSSLARAVLIQALLAVPFFTTRWRWNVTRALAIKRHQGGARVPPPLQRFRADDLLSAVFPMATACLEHITGDIELPDHPLIRQTVDDCLTEACDMDGILKVLSDLEAGAVKPIGIDTREPSPFSHELLNANPYAFLDDAPLEERRARAVSLRRTLPIDALRELGRLDPEAIAQVRAEAWPLVRDADELHDALLSLVALPADEGREWTEFFTQLQTTRRAAGISPLIPHPINGVANRESSAEHDPGAVASHSPGRISMSPRFRSAFACWVAAERLPIVRAIWGDVPAEPEVPIPDGVRTDWSREDAIVELVRGRMEVAGPIAESTLAETLSLPLEDVQRALMFLELQGIVLRGNFLDSEANTQSDWCERRLLARIHRLTLDGLRRQIQPVEPERFVQFLVRHQHRHPQTKLRGQAGLLQVIEKLQGFEAPAGDWERFLL
ncbi:MAG: DEAD/DEAH box helicase, partial [Gemmataceae bacterium]